jgi:hypothetical protein
VGQEQEPWEFESKPRNGLRKQTHDFQPLAGPKADNLKRLAPADSAGSFGIRASVASNEAGNVTPSIQFCNRLSQEICFGLAV